MSNKYHDRMLGEPDQPINAERLLDIMRPQVEEVLNEVLPYDGAPSQSSRAYRAIEKVEASLADIRQSRTVEMERGIDTGNERRAQLAVRNRQREVLRDFLSVHRTVWILEGRAI